MSELATEKLVSVDSHVHFTDDWVKASLRKELHSVWDEANRTGEEYAAKVLRGGKKNLDIEEFVEPKAAMDLGHLEPKDTPKASDIAQERTEGKKGERKCE